MIRSFRRVRQKPKAHPLVKLLVDKMNEQGVGVTEMCKEAGISRNAFGKWGRDQGPTLANIAACFNVLGYQITAQPRGDVYRREFSGAKEFVITSPHGAKYQVLNLKRFCDEWKLSYESMRDTARGHQSSHKGWKVSKVV